RANPYLGESARDGDVRDRRGWHRRTVISICRSAVDQSRQVGGARPGAYPGADMDEDFATASRGELKRLRWRELSSRRISSLTCEFCCIFVRARHILERNPVKKRPEAPDLDDDGLDRR